MKPGIYDGISNTDYHADKDSYSSSIIKLMDVPSVAKYNIDNPGEYKDCFRIGGAIHKHVLEPADFAKEFLTGIDTPRRSAADRSDWAKWFYANGGDGDHITAHKATEWNGMFEASTGKHMVTPAEIEEIKLMGESVFSNSNAKQLLEGGKAEQSIYWQDKETGLNLRCRPDFLSSFCSDLKSCQSAKPGAVSREIVNRGYHISAAMYQEGVSAATGACTPFTFIFIEKTPPYLCAVYCLDDDSQRLGYETFRKYLNKLAKCLESDEWPGLEDNLELPLPIWAFN